MCMIQFDDLPSVPRPQQRLSRDLDPVSRVEYRTVRTIARSLACSPQMDNRGGRKREGETEKETEKKP
ncbi:hypothetical protein BOTCAL_0025g00020 [Botryotinia calthae]|uniref:Uncharacterized protein n=1 Tax=Botryotinia calthae TaxID=38488 RepID=A0A4Y8DGC6_9HELO|nr:hypothetical protein BOTCAL_0025g00020 [Botryotinia calthae]